MRWRCWRILAHAHSAMAERRQVVVVVVVVVAVVVVAVVNVGGYCAGGGGVSSFFLFVIFFAGGAPNGALVAIWEDASAIGVKVCVSQDRAPTHSRGRRMD